MEREIIMIEEAPPLKGSELRYEPDELIEELDYEEVLRRQDDIDQLTADYISNLVYPHGYEAVDLEPAVLEQIENRFEEVLADEFGIYIYRPTVLYDKNGAERVVASAYEDDSDDWGAGIDVEDFG